MQDQLEECVLMDKYGSKRQHVRKTCLHCEMLFWTRKDWHIEGKGLYCTKKCSGESKRKPKIAVICSCCGETKELKPYSAKMEPKHGFRFCSKACKNKSQGIGKLIQPSNYGSVVRANRCVNFSLDRKCLSCKCDLKKGQNSYCSSVCKKQYRFANYIRRWMNKEVDGNIDCGESLSGFVREYMLKKAGYKCEKCGWNEINAKSGRIPLTINHIDGISSNSIEKNLEVLCPNCHSLTPNYGSLNRGNGRKQRRIKCRVNYNGVTL